MPHPLGNDRERTRQILVYIGNQALPRIIQLTTPLFAPTTRGDPQLVASGIVLEIASARFLITATHVLSGWPDVAISTGDELHPIRGNHVTLHSGGTVPGSEQDRLDVSVVRLEARIAAAIPSTFAACLDDLDFSVMVIGHESFLLSGYPERRNRRGLKGDQFTAQAYSLIIHDGDQALYDAVGADPTLQLVVPFEPNAVWDIEKQMTAPNLRGVSGGGVWRIPIDRQPVRETRLSAIATEQHRKGRNRHVLATRIRVVLGLIYQHNEDMRGALKEAYEAVG